jgi:hypothetical protein
MEDPMRRFRRYVTVAAGLALLAATGTLPASRLAIADNVKQVEIASPLPLPVNANIVQSVPLTAFVIPLAPVEPFQRQTFLTIADGTTGNLVSFDVPEGKRLVIEQVGGTIFLPAGQFTRVSQIRTDFRAPFSLIANKVSDQSDNVYLVNAPMKLYADENVEFSISRGPASAGSALCTFSVSGYLVTLESH